MSYFEDFYNSLLDTWGEKLPPKDLMNEMGRVFRELFIEEFAESKPRAEPFALEKHLDRENLRDLKIANDETFVLFEHALRQSFEFIYEKLPYTFTPLTFDAPSFSTLPLYSLIPKQLIQDTILPLLTSGVERNHLFQSVRKQIHKNFTAARHPPRDFKGTTEEAVETYLHDTPFYRLFHVPIPFTIPREAYSRHGIILAEPGHGKTQLISTLCYNFLTDPDPPALIVLDPAGDFFASLKDKIDPQRLVILDPDTDPPPLNFLDFGSSTATEALQTFKYLMAALSGGLSDKQRGIVPYVLKLVRAIPDATIETLGQIVDEKVKQAEKSQFWPYIETLHPIEKAFFQNQFYSSMQVTKDAIAWKLSAALGIDAFRDMFSSNTNSLDLDAIIRERKVLLVKGGFDTLTQDGMDVFLQFILAQYYSAGMRRSKIPEKDRHLCLMIVDECSHIYTSPTVTDVLTDLRKFQCGLIGATQFIARIPPAVQSAVYGATAIKIAGHLQHDDAYRISREINMPTDAIKALHSEHKRHAEWACHISNVTRSGAVKLTIPFGALDKLPKTGYKPPKWPKARKPPVKEASVLTRPNEVPASSNEGRGTTTIPPATKRPTPEPRKTPPNTINREKDYDH